MMSSGGQDTDGIIAGLLVRLDMVEEVNRALEDEQRRTRRRFMHLENVVASIWGATMGPKPRPRPRPKKRQH